MTNLISRVEYLRLLPAIEVKCLEHKNGRLLYGLERNRAL